MKGERREILLAFCTDMRLSPIFKKTTTDNAIGSARRLYTFQAGMTDDFFAREFEQGRTEFTKGREKYKLS